jgi:hypothetical protein
MGGFKPSGAKASSPRPPSSAGEERKSIVAAGKVLFAAVLPPKDADAEDARFVPAPRATLPRSAILGSSRPSSRVRERARRRVGRAARTTRSPRAESRAASISHLDVPARPPVRRPSVFPPNIRPVASLPRAPSVAVKSALATAPAHYAVLERECGAIVYVGAGTPRASAPGPAHAPQVFATDELVVVLVSSTLDAPRVARAFRDAREGDDEPRARAVALKLAVRALSDESHRFSFVVLDLASGRVFAASTAHSAPLALGHAHDGARLASREIFFDISCRPLVQARRSARARLTSRSPRPRVAPRQARSW